MTLYGGLYGGAALALINAITFVAASSDTSSTLYLILTILIDGTGAGLTYLFFDEVEAYLIWEEAITMKEEAAVEKIVEEEEEEEEEEIVKSIAQKEEEKEIAIVIEPIIDEEDDSPFTDFHVVAF